MILRVGLLLIALSAVLLFLLTPIYGIILIREGKPVSGVLLIIGFFAFIFICVVAIQEFSGYSIQDLF